MNKFEFKFRKLLSGKLSGGFNSFFKGSGIDLEDFRKYEVGDEPRYINWKLSAKHGSLFIKVFKLEKDTQVHVFFDLNNNWNSGISYINKNKVLDLFSEIVIYSKKYGSKLYGYYPENGNIKSMQIGNDLIKSKYIINKINIELSSQKNTYISNLDKFISIQKNISKKHIIIIFSDFLNISSLETKLLNILSIKNELFLIKLNINDLDGLNFNKFIVKNTDIPLKIQSLDDF